MNKLKIIGLALVGLLLISATIIYFKPSVLGWTMLQMSTGYGKLRQFFSGKTIVENFTFMNKDSMPQPDEVPSGGSSTSGTTNYQQEQNDVNDVISEIKGYVSDSNIEDNMTFYYQKYCGDFGMSKDTAWSGVLTVISNDGKYVYATMNLTYTTIEFICDGALVNPIYVVVINYAGFVNVEQKFRVFANEVMQMQEPSETDIATKSFSLGQMLYSYLLNGHISWYKLG